MPPTKGHLALLQFANQLASNGVVAIINTQPHEPLTRERVSALRQAIEHSDLRDHVKLIHYNKAIEQDPTAPGFWPMWQKLMEDFGITKNDAIVASERYGKKLAEITGTKFYPYDIDRVITPVKATPIRENPLEHFDEILPKFRPFLQTRVTIFGAESTGKTTLSRQIADEMGGTWLFEYARPYLEETTNEITIESMESIWLGQRALQIHASQVSESPLIVQDTDLFSTVGYWQFPHWQSKLGGCPPELVKDARRLSSDLYIVTKSNIPFEADPLRYGGDEREGSDEYWIKLCDRYHLPYIVLDGADPHERLVQAIDAIKVVQQKRCQQITYDRHDL